MVLSLVSSCSAVGGSARRGRADAGAGQFVNGEGVRRCWGSADRQGVGTGGLCEGVPRAGGGHPGGRDEIAALQEQEVRRDVRSTSKRQKNLDIYGDKTVSVDLRAQKAGLLGDYVPIFVLYGNAIKPENTFDSEALELGGFVLRAELEAARVVDEFKAAHDMKEDNAGFKQVFAGFAQTIGGVFEVMMDHASIRTSETTRFVGELKEFLPKLVAELTPEAQQQFKAKLIMRGERGGCMKIERGVLTRWLCCNAGRRDIMPENMNLPVLPEELQPMPIV